MHSSSDFPPNSHLHLYLTFIFYSEKKDVRGTREILIKTADAIWCQSIINNEHINYSQTEIVVLSEIYALCMHSINMPDGRFKVFQGDQLMVFF